MHDDTFAVEINDGSLIEIETRGGRVLLAYADRIGPTRFRTLSARQAMRLAQGLAWAAQTVLLEGGDQQ